MAIKGKIQNVRGQRSSRWTIGKGIILVLLDLPYSLNILCVSSYWNIGSIVIVDRERKYDELELCLRENVLLIDYIARCLELRKIYRHSWISLIILQSFGSPVDLLLMDSVRCFRYYPQIMITDKPPINPLAWRSMTIMPFRKLV